jgi:membrane-bound lytic murein transglycosylase F
MGLCQFMPGTWREEMQRRGVNNASPFNPYLSIDAAASYDGRLRRIWKSDRPESDRRRLVFGCYNAGCGNILKAQKACNNARHWPEISPCLIEVTGPRNSHETLTYVKRIEWWYLFFTAAS